MLTKAKLAVLLATAGTFTLTVSWDIIELHHLVAAASGAVGIVLAILRHRHNVRRNRDDNERL